MVDSGKFIQSSPKSMFLRKWTIKL